MSNRLVQWLVTGLALSVVPACGNPNDLQEGGESAAVVELKAGSATPAYFSVRRDLRKCVSPLCGGYFVTQLNGNSPASYVAEIDYRSAGLTSADLVNGDPEIVRGTIVSKTFASFGDLHALIASEAWDASSTATASGTFYQLTDKHIACFAAPCFDLHETTLNASGATDLSGISASDTQLSQAARAAVSTDAILVAGVNRTVPRSPGMVHKGKVVDISQFYTRVVHQAPSCALVDCQPGQHCELVQVQCITTPCDPQPTCVGDPAPFCGGIAGIRCAGNAQCLDNPNDQCDPARGGADCGGICVCPPNNKLCLNGYHWDGSANVCACVPDATGPACGKNTCAVGQVCCNASCGVCTPPGYFCSMIACQ